MSYHPMQDRARIPRKVRQENERTGIKEWRMKAAERRKGKVLRK